MKKKNLKLVLIFILVLFSIVRIGYAVSASNIKINGTATSNVTSFDVHFDNIQVIKGKDLEIKKVNLDSTNTTLDFDVALNIPGDQYIFTVDVINSGNVDAMIHTVEKTMLDSEQQKYLTYEVTYLDGKKVKHGDKLYVGDKTTYVIKVEYKSDLNNEDLPKEDVKGLELTFNTEYIQNDSSKK